MHRRLVALFAIVFGSFSAPAAAQEAAADPAEDDSPPAAEPDDGPSAAAAERDEPPPTATREPAAPPADVSPPAKAPPPAEGARDEDEFGVEDARREGLEVGEGTADPAHGLGVDGKDYELPAKTVEELGGLSPEEIEAVREVTPAEIGELDLDREMAPEALAQLEAQADALEGLSPDDLEKLAALYKDVLRRKLREVKDATHDKTVAKIQAKNEESVGLIASILGWFSLAGVLLLLMPFGLGRRYPGQTSKLFGYSALAAGTFVVSMLLFTGVLLGMRVVQGAVGEETHPQVVLQDATFDAADEHVDDIAAMPGLLLAPLEQVATGEEESFGSALLENATAFKEDFEAFKKIAEGFKSVQAVVGYVAPILTLLAVVLFLANLRFTIRDILRFPDRAMRGEITAGQALKQVGRRLGGEVVATLLTLLVLVAITIATSVTMTIVAVPAMSMFVGQLLATLEYVFVDPAAKQSYVYVGLGSVLAFVLVAVFTIFVAAVLYIGKVQKIFRARCCDGVPLGAHKAFFGRRSLGLAWILALPILTLVATSELSDYLVEKGTSGAEFDWFVALVPAPLALGLGYLVLFGAVFGLKSLVAIARYKVEGSAPDAAVAQAAQAIPVR